MKVYSVLRPEAWEKLRDDGELHNSWDYVVESWGGPESAGQFVEAYHWMCREMDKRGIPIGVNPPHWVWEREVKSSESGLVDTGAPAVLLTMEIPDHLILLSNFAAWHSVLNHCFVWFSDEEIARDDLDNFSQEEIEDSWQRIFDNEACVAAEFGDWQQGVVPYFLREWVKNVEYFIGAAYVEEDIDEDLDEEIC